MALGTRMNTINIRSQSESERNFKESVLILVNYSYFTRIPLVCTRMYLCFTRMLLVCARVLLVCYSYVLVCYSYVIRMYSYVTRMYPCVTRMYSCVTRMLLVCTRVVFKSRSSSCQSLQGSNKQVKAVNNLKKSDFVQG